MGHRLWTFLVRGTEPVSLQPPGNPVATHNGGTSVSHLMLTNDQAEQVEFTITQEGNTVERWVGAEQTVEQRAERLAFLGVGKDESDYLSPMCPSCFWFDPMVKQFCGRATWPPETIEAAIKAHESARKGQTDCPVKEW